MKLKFTGIALFGGLGWLSIAALAAAKGDWPMLAISITATATCAFVAHKIQKEVEKQQNRLVKGDKFTFANETYTASAFWGPDGKKFDTAKDAVENNPQGATITVENEEFGGFHDIETVTPL